MSHSRQFPKEEEPKKKAQNNGYTSEKHLLSSEVFFRKSSSQCLPSNSALLQGTSLSRSTLQSPRTSHELTKSDNLVRFLPVGESQSSLASPLFVPRRPKARKDSVHRLVLLQFSCTTEREKIRKPGSNQSAVLYQRFNCRY